MTRSLHLLGSGDTNKGEHQGERHADGVASGQTGTRKLGVDGTALARQHLAGSIEAVEVTSEFLGKVRQTERARSRAQLAIRSVSSLSLRERASSVGSVNSE